MASRGQRKAAAKERVGEDFREPKPGCYWDGSAWVPIEIALAGHEPPIPEESMTRRERKTLGNAFRAGEEVRLKRDLSQKADKASHSLQAKRIGRPPMDFNPELGAEICHRLANGQALTEICNLPHMPDNTTVYKWMDRTPSFARDYIRARENQAHTLFDECLAIADDVSGDVIDNPDGTQTVNTVAVTRAKLRIDTRLRMAGKLAPKVYSERAGALGLGEGGTVNVQVNAMTIDARTLDSGQRDKLRSLLISARDKALDV